MATARGSSGSHGARRTGARTAAVALSLLLLAVRPGDAAPPATATAPLPKVAATALELSYDVYYSVLRLLTIRSHAHVEPDVYSLRSSMETVGMIGTLFPWSYRSEVHGRVQGAKLAPDVFNSRSEFRDTVQQVSLRYGDGGPVGEVSPFDLDILGEDYEREEVPVELRNGTIDPLTEIAALTQQLARGGDCSGVRNVYDGLRRYDVVYEDLGETELEESSYDGYAGRARQCRSRLLPIAGFWKPKDDKERDSVTAVTAWLMPPLPGAAPAPVRLTVEGRRGTLWIHLTKAKTTDAAS